LVACTPITSLAGLAGTVLAQPTAIAARPTQAIDKIDLLNIMFL
jgi:hypothetical protein